MRFCVDEGQVSAAFRINKFRPGVYRPICKHAPLDGDQEYANQYESTSDRSGAPLGITRGWV
jgi:hypothetical protein